MSDYTPTTEEIRDKYILNAGGDWLDPVAFDRWLDNIIQKAKADGWDECGRDLHGEEYEMSEMYLRNPYRDS